jgi:exopolysaccharide biosynthesis polyprenyl glycosylphosphotransferase
VCLADLRELPRARPSTPGRKLEHAPVHWRPVVTKPLVGAGSGEDAGDIRRAPVLPSTLQLRTLVRRLASVLALAVLDVGGLAVALYLALVLRQLYYGETPILWGFAWTTESDWLPFLAVVTVLVFWHNGLYASREQRSGAGRVVSSLLLVTVVTLAFAIGSGYPHTTYGLYAIAFVLSVAVIGGLRASYEILTRDMWRIAGVRRRAVLLGENDRLVDLRRALGLGRSGIDYDFLGALTPDGSDDPLLTVLGSVSDVESVLARLHPDELIVSGADLDDGALLEVVDLAHQSGVKVQIAPTTTELLTQRAEYVPGQGVPLFELRQPVFAGWDWVVKRAFDLAVSSLLVVLGTPVWLLLAAAVKLDSSGPVFYRDRRVGLGEREFGMFKFRSMYTDAGDRQAALEVDNEASGPLFKIKDDPRVTRVGKILRRYSIDELPQVLNVLRGEMSLVGPRPLPLRDYVQLEEWHRKRYLVLPGMTGLWQVSGRIELTFDDLVRLDFYYLENWSIWLDISILSKTLPAVAARRGAY